MEREAGANYQHVLLMQIAQHNPNINVLGRAECVYEGNLNTWNIGLGIHDLERNKDAMIEASGLI